MAHYSWLNYNDKIVYIKFEDLKEQFKYTMSKLFERINKNDIPKNIKKPRKNIKLISKLFTKIYNLGINIPIESTNIYSGKKRKGDWQLYFSDKDIDFLNHEIGVDYLNHLGYKFK